MAVRRRAFDLHTFAYAARSQFEQRGSKPTSFLTFDPRPLGSGPVGLLRRIRRKWWLAFLLVLLANYALASLALPSPPETLDLPYTQFKRLVEAGKVVEVVSRGDLIQGRLREPMTYPETGERARTSAQFATFRPAFADPGLEALLEAQAVVINARPLEAPRPWWLNLLLAFGPTALLIGGLLFFTRRSGMFGLGRSRAQRYQPEATQRVTFDDVAGIEEAREELVEIVDFLRDPEKYTRLGGTAPKGVLLVGSPGTGKTLLARAVAGEAGVPFFSVGGAEFVEMVVGVGASRVRDLFKQAREAAPAIVFIDELDAVGRVRGSVINASGRESEQALNQILTEMDGFSSREGVIILAATNRPDVLDPALLRPGRFDRRVAVQAPDRVGREAILHVHTRNVPLDEDVDLADLAGTTPGLVGADLRNLVNEAALLAARRAKSTVGAVEFLDAVEKLTLGPARHLLLSLEERQRIAYHEAGHAILALLLPEADPVTRVTIMPRGQALGVTYQRPDDDHYNLSEKYVRVRIVGAMGGRAAEEIVYGTRTTGAENDLQQVSELARLMVTRWGMSDELGPVTLAAREGPYLALPGGLNFGAGPRPYSEATAQRIDAEVQSILRESYAEAVRLLSAHRAEMDKLVEALLERETVDETEIRAVTGLSRPLNGRAHSAGPNGQVADGKVGTQAEPAST